MTTSSTGSRSIGSTAGPSARRGREADTSSLGTRPSSHTGPSWTHGSDVEQRGNLQDQLDEAIAEGHPDPQPANRAEEEISRRGGGTWGRRCCLVFTHGALLVDGTSALAAGVGETAPSAGGFGVLINSLQVSAITSSTTMIVNDGWYRSGPTTPAAIWWSAMALTISGPSTPAVDQAVSSRPWIAPTSW